MKEFLLIISPSSPVYTLGSKKFYLRLVYVYICRIIKGREGKNDNGIATSSPPPASVSSREDAHGILDSGDLRRIRRPSRVSPSRHIPENHIFSTKQRLRPSPRFFYRRYINGAMPRSVDIRRSSEFLPETSSVAVSQMVAKGLYE